MEISYPINFIYFIASSVGYKKSEVEEVYIAPKAEKKKKEKGSKADNSKKVHVL